MSRSVIAWLNDAEDRALDWDRATTDYVAARKPPEHERLKAWGWVLAVSACQRPGETPQQTCDRLVAYVKVYREAYGVTLSPDRLAAQAGPR